MHVKSKKGSKESTGLILDEDGHLTGRHEETEVPSVCPVVLLPVAIVRGNHFSLDILQTRHPVGCYSFSLVLCKFMEIRG